MNKAYWTWSVAFLLYICWQAQQ